MLTLSGSSTGTSLPIRELRPILYQLANALSRLSAMGIIHADLKPENVMVVDRTQSPIKMNVIDFGLACPVSAVIPGDCVQTVWYRVPEVMLQAPFDQAIDMWSLGLIAVELAIGRPLYPDLFFIRDNCSDQRWKFKSEKQLQHETGYQAQETRYVKLKRLDDLEQLMKMKTGHQSSQDLLTALNLHLRNI
uniref:Protein kinase domain-containing protein n=1 Tax=Amphilophus citrinellus TaxID=61819 RepID=A0A3Q0RVK1_AMPCI